jgi:hypothetical protein
MTTFFAPTMIKVSIVMAGLDPAIHEAAPDADFTLE